MKSTRSWWTVAAIITLVILTAASNAFAEKTTFVSTDFNMRHFDRTLWTLTSSANDGAIALVNPGTTDAAVRITAPAGTEHDIWMSGDHTIRIMQPATNTDFNLETKFFSGLAGGTSASFQCQGVMVEQDDNNKIIFSFTTGTTPDSIYAYAATFIGGYSSPVVKVFTKVAPLATGNLWIRVSRTGDSWKQYYSLDGTTWDSSSAFVQTLTMEKIGLFADNAGSRPQAFASSVDYFHNLDSIQYGDDTQALPTDTQGPWIHSVHLLNYASNAAQVAWQTDEMSDGKIDYGTTTSYGRSVFDLNMDYTHYAIMTGLTANTLYNYRVLGGDAALNVSNSDNFTFTSDVITNDVSSQSDGFSNAVLDAATWSVVNPVGDATVSITADQLSISVPAGVAHEYWTDGDRAPRVVQTIPGTTARDYMVRFNSGVSGTASAYRFEGILLEDAVSRSIRIDFVSSPTGTWIFCASFFGLETAVVRFNTEIGTSGAAPLYMRVQQSGALWTVNYSFDGSTWTQAGSFYDFFYPVKVGITGGNSGTAPPAFTALVDFFQGARAASPRLNSPLNDATGLALPVTITWNPGIAATGYHAQVAKDSTFATIVANDSLLTNPTKLLSGLQNNQRYFWRVRSKNSNGSSVYSDVWHFTTTPGIPGAPVLVAPLNNAVNVAVNQTLRWNTITNAITYYVQFGKDSLFASPIVNDSTITDTTRAVNGLDLNTKYFWRVRASTPGGAGPFSAVWQFTTVVPAPGAVVLSLPVDNAVTRDSVKFVWFKAQPSVTRYYLEHAPDSAFQFSTIDSNLVDTTKTVKGLPNTNTYYWRVRAKNLSGWGPFSEVRRFRFPTEGVATEKGIPAEYTLSQNYPNPFNPASRIEFGLPHSGNVTLEVFNMLGERVAVLVDENMEAGYHQVSFDGTRLASGIYFYRIVTNNTMLMKKMALVK